MVDGVVIGAGVAGAGLALELRRADWNVVLIDDAPGDQDTTPRPDWITAAGVEALEALGVDRSAWCGDAFDGASFHSGDFKKQAVSKDSDRPAYRADYAALVEALRVHADSTGVNVVAGCRAGEIDADETHVRVAGGSESEKAASWDGAFAVHADGAAGHCRRHGQQPAFWIAEAAVAFDGANADASLHWMLAAGDAREWFMWWFASGQVVIRLVAEGSRDEVARRFSECVSRLGAYLGLGGEATSVEARMRPAAAPSALERESHVGKRSLAIGDAGGFVAASSREGIYPALWSAKLAAEVLIEARDSTHPQDTLRTFSTKWRSTMAEYLRPPNTDLQFLLPLIFSNRQMADRLASAFWTGENI